MSCFDNVIGLSKRDCNCLPSKPVDFTILNASKSGYYVDNTKWSVTLNDDIFTDCSSSGIWQTFKESRDEAIIDLNAHLLQEIGNYQTPRYGNIQATIGEKQKYTLNINQLSRDFLGLKIRPITARGSVLTIRSLGLAIAESGTYNIKLVKEDGTVLFNQDVTGGSNTITSVSVTWKYRFTKLESLYLVYDRQDGFPINTELYCQPCDSSRPYYTTQVYVRGIQSDGTTMTNLVESVEGNRSYGLFVDFTFQCDYIDWLCDMHDDFWATNPFGALYAKCLQLYSSYYLNERIIKSNKINYYTLTDGEYLTKLNAEIMGVLSELVPELASRLPDDFVDCFCRKSYGNQEIRTLIV